LTVATIVISTPQSALSTWDAYRCSFRLKWGFMYWSLRSHVLHQNRINFFISFHTNIYNIVSSNSTKWNWVNGTLSTKTYTHLQQRINVQGKNKVFYHFFVLYEGWPNLWPHICWTQDKCGTIPPSSGRVRGASVMCTPINNARWQNGSRSIRIVRCFLRSTLMIWDIYWIAYVFGLFRRLIRSIFPGWR
jgi:hypothetical protein